MIRLFALPVAAGVALLALAHGSLADPTASDWAAVDQAKVRLISAVSATGNGTVPLGLQFELQAGWKTYWRSPGDAGFPVTVDWSGSTNLAGADLSWPAPRRFSLFGLDTFGYEDEVVLPIAAKAVDPAKPLGLRLKVDYLVCEKVCIPYTARLSLDLPAGPAGPSDFAQLIDRFAASVPGDGAAHGLKLLSAAAAGDQSAPHLIVSVNSAFPFDHPDLIVEGPSGLNFPAPRVAIDGDGRLALFDIGVHRDAKAPLLAGTPLVLTVTDGDRGLEARVLPETAVGSPLWPALIAALLGGLILNLMPCVLPVLSLKLLAFVGHGGANPSTVRFSFLASTAGVLASFVVLAAAVAAMKAAGVAVGWGVQFQQPYFLVGMALLLTLFAANLWGWFEVPLPGFAGKLAAATDRHHGHLGDFLSGALATLLATPCTVPFLGTAVGFALGGSTVEIFIIFLAMGLGLAAPYLVVAALPALATRLPRPGSWMIWLKRLLALALVGTAIWLLYALAGQIGEAASLTVGAALLAIVLLFAFSRLPIDLRRAGLAVAAMVALLAPAVMAQRPAPDRPGAGVWQVFSEPVLAKLIGEGHIVLVDVTADWCINCQVNETLVLDRGWAAEALAAGRVIGLKADWTRPDPAIARYLASFGRYGIPFNAIYGPHAQQGLPLPALLTEGALRDAVTQAGGG